MRVDVFSIKDEPEEDAQSVQTSEGEQVVEIMPQQPLGIIERAQIDTQIATAKQFPRSLTEALEKAKSLACYSPLIASECTYKVPRGNKKITGPSIRIAEIMGTSWGNLRYGGRVLAVGERTVTCQGVCHDLETNVSASVEVSRSIVDKDKHRYSDDMIVTTSMAGVAIGIRNAIFKIIPGAFVTEVRTAAQKVARGEDQGLESRLESALAFFEGKGIPKARVFLALGIKGAADVTWEHIDTLLGYATSIRVEGVPITDIFPNAPAPAPEQPPTPPEPPAGDPPEPPKKETPEPPAPPVEGKDTKAARGPISAGEYDWAYNVVVQRHGTWEQIYAAMGIQGSGEVTEEHKVMLYNWAERLRAGEPLATVLVSPTATSDIPAPPAPPAPPVEEPPKKPAEEATPTKIPESNSATEPATDTAPENFTYAEAAYVLGQHGASWAAIYDAVGLSDAGEMSKENKATVIEWAKRVSAGEKLEAVLGLPPLQTPPGPPAGEALFGKKAADAAEAEAAATPKTTVPGATQLDF